MATTLRLRDTKLNGIGVFRDMATGQGPGTTTGVVNTSASGTQIQWTKTAGGENLEWITGRSPAGGFTLSGTMTFNIWAFESNMNANCGGRSRVFERTSGGSETEIGGGPYNDGVEFGTTDPPAAALNWTGTPTSTTIEEDNRLICRYYITNVGTMASGHTCTINYAGTSAGANGDSTFQINENVTFKLEPISGTLDKALDDLTKSLLGAVDVFGTASKTLDTITTDLDATVEVRGTLDKTLDGLSIDADGIVEAATVNGTLDKTLDGITVDLDGTVAIVGTSAPTLEGVGLDADGTVDVVASLDKALDGITLDADAVAPIVGTLDRTLDGIGVDADGAVEVKGTTDKTLDGIGLDADGVVGNAPVTGTLDRTLDGIGLSVAVRVDVEAEVDRVLAEVLLASVGTVPVVGTLARDLDGLGVQAAGVVDITGTLSETLDDCFLERPPLADAPKGKIFSARPSRVYVARSRQTYEVAATRTYAHPAIEGEEA